MTQAQNLEPNYEIDDVARRTSELAMAMANAEQAFQMNDLDVARTAAAAPVHNVVELASYERGTRQTPEEPHMNQMAAEARQMAEQARQTWSDELAA
jgi:hypothetical protein